MVRALVKEQAGLLPAEQVGHVGGPVHRHRERARTAAPSSTTVSSGSPSSPRDRPVPFLTTVVTPVTATSAATSAVQMRLGPGGIGLDHGHIAEAVDDDAGQAIGLGMDQPVEGRIEQARAQGQRGARAGAANQA